MRGSGAGDVLGVLVVAAAVAAPARAQDAAPPVTGSAALAEPTPPEELRAQLKPMRPKGTVAEAG